MYTETKALIENTIFEARMKNDNIISYRIKPVEGYKLHEKTLDKYILNDDGEETGDVILGFTTAYVTAGANYNFEANDREIYCVPIDSTK